MNTFFTVIAWLAIGVVALFFCMYLALSVLIALSDYSDGYE